MQVLQDKYEGFLSRDFIPDFVNYADVLFKEFGGKIQHWMTFNEPWVRGRLGGACHDSAVALQTGL
jgi:beta-glucosidase